MTGIILTQSDELTMSSSQLAELLGFESKSSINKAIRKVFDDSRLEPCAERDARGYVSEYHLPELESKMFVAKHNIEYLEMITQYWIDKKEPQWLADLSPEAKVAIADLSSQRNAALARAEIAERTKAQIGSKREATALNKLSQQSKQIKKKDELIEELEDKLQDVGSYLSLIAADLPQRVDTPTRSNVQSWRLLNNLSSDMQLPPKKVKDERYGKVNAYHIEVIARFKDMYL